MLSIRNGHLVAEGGRVGQRGVVVGREFGSVGRQLLDAGLQLPAAGRALFQLPVQLLLFGGQALERLLQLCLLPRRLPTESCALK